MAETNKAVKETKENVKEVKETVKAVKVTDDVNAYLNERVPFRAFKDNDKYKDDLIVIVNGKTWQIQRGVTVMIPRYVYLTILQAERQKVEAARYSQMLEDQYKSRESGLMY
jgi:hypothetical protein